MNRSQHAAWVIQTALGFAWAALGALAAWMSAAWLMPGLAHWLYTYGIHVMTWAVMTVMVVSMFLPARSRRQDEFAVQTASWQNVLRGAAVCIAILLMTAGDLWNRSYLLSFLLLVIVSWHLLVLLAFPSFLLSWSTQYQVTRSSSRKLDALLERAKSGGKGQRSPLGVFLVGPGGISTAIVHGVERSVHRTQRSLVGSLEDSYSAEQILDDCTQFVLCLKLEISLKRLLVERDRYVPGRAPFDRVKEARVIVLHCSLVAYPARHVQPLPGAFQELLELLDGLLVITVKWARTTSDSLALESVEHVLSRDMPGNAYELYSYACNQCVPERKLELSEIDRSDFSLARSIAISLLHRCSLHGWAERVATFGRSSTAGIDSYLEEVERDPEGAIATAVLQPMRDQSACLLLASTMDDANQAEKRRIEAIGAGIKRRIGMSKANTGTSSRVQARDVSAVPGVPVPGIASLRLHHGPDGAYWRPAQFPAAVIAVVVLILLCVSLVLARWTTWADAYPVLADSTRPADVLLDHVDVLSVDADEDGDQLFIGTASNGLMRVRTNMFAVTHESSSPGMDGPQPGRLDLLEHDAQSGTLVARVERQGRGLDLRAPGGTWSTIIQASRLDSVNGKFPVDIARIDDDRIVLAFPDRLVLYEESKRSLSTITKPDSDLQTSVAIVAIEQIGDMTWGIVRDSEGNKLFGIEWTGLGPGDWNFSVVTDIPDGAGEPHQIMAQGDELLVRTENEALLSLSPQGNWTRLLGGKQWQDVRQATLSHAHASPGQDAACLVMQGDNWSQVGTRLAGGHTWSISDRLPLLEEHGLALSPGGKFAVVVTQDGDGMLLRIDAQHPDRLVPEPMHKDWKVQTIDSNEDGLLLLLSSTDPDTLLPRRRVSYESWDQLQASERSRPAWEHQSLRLSGSVLLASARVSKPGSTWILGDNGELAEYLVGTRSGVGPTYTLADQEGNHLRGIVAASLHDERLSVTMPGDRLYFYDLSSVGGRSTKSSLVQPVERSYVSSSRRQVKGSVEAAWDTHDGFEIADSSGATWRYDISYGWSPVDDGKQIKPSSMARRSGDRLVAITQAAELVERGPANTWDVLHNGPCLEILPSNGDLAVRLDDGSIIGFDGPERDLMPALSVAGLGSTFQDAAFLGTAGSRRLLVADDLGVAEYNPADRTWTRRIDGTGSIRLVQVGDSIVRAWMENAGEILELNDDDPGFKVVLTEVREIYVGEGGSIIALSHDGSVHGLPGQAGHPIQLRSPNQAVNAIAPRKACVVGKTFYVLGNGEVQFVDPLDGRIQELPVPGNDEVVDLAAAGTDDLYLRLASNELRRLSGGQWKPCNLVATDLVQMDGSILVIEEDRACTLIQPGGLERRVLPGSSIATKGLDLEPSGQVLVLRDRVLVEALDRKRNAILLEFKGINEAPQIKHSFTGSMSRPLAAKERLWIVDDDSVHAIDRRGRIEQVANVSPLRLVDMPSGVWGINDGGLSPLQFMEDHSKQLHGRTVRNLPPFVSALPAAGTDALLVGNAGSLFTYDSKQRHIDVLHRVEKGHFDSVQSARLLGTRNVLLEGKLDGHQAIEIVSLADPGNKRAPPVKIRSHALDVRGGTCVAIDLSENVIEGSPGGWITLQAAAVKKNPGIKRILIASTRKAYMLGEDGVLYRYSNDSGLLPLFTGDSFAEMWSSEKDVYCFDGEGISILSRARDQPRAFIPCTDVHASDGEIYLRDLDRVFRIDGQDAWKARAYPGRDVIAVGSRPGGPLLALDEDGILWSYDLETGRWKKSAVIPEIQGQSWTNAVLAFPGRSGTWIVHDRGVAQVSLAADGNKIHDTNRRPLLISTGKGESIAWMDGTGPLADVFRDGLEVDADAAIDAADIRRQLWNGPSQNTFQSYEVADSRWFLGNQGAISVGRDGSPRIRQWHRWTQTHGNAKAWDASLMGLPGSLVLLSQAGHRRFALLEPDGEIIEKAMPRGVKSVQALGWIEGSLWFAVNGGSERFLELSYKSDRGGGPQLDINLVTIQAPAGDPSPARGAKVYTLGESSGDLVLAIDKGSVMARDEIDSPWRVVPTPRNILNWTVWQGPDGFRLQGSDASGTSLLLESGDRVTVSPDGDQVQWLLPNGNQASEQLGLVPAGSMYISSKENESIYLLQESDRGITRWAIQLEFIRPSLWTWKQWLAFTVSDPVEMVVVADELGQLVLAEQGGNVQHSYERMYKSADETVARLRTRINDGRLEVPGVYENLFARFTSAAEQLLSPGEIGQGGVPTWEQPKQLAMDRGGLLQVRSDDNAYRIDPASGRRTRVVQEFLLLKPPRSLPGKPAAIEDGFLLLGDKPGTHDVHVATGRIRGSIVRHLAQDKNEKLLLVLENDRAIDLQGKPGEPAKPGSPRESNLALPFSGTKDELKARIGDRWVDCGEILPETALSIDQLRQGPGAFVVADDFTYVDRNGNAWSQKGQARQLHPVEVPRSGTLALARDARGGLHPVVINGNRTRLVVDGRDMPAGMELVNHPLEGQGTFRGLQWTASSSGVRFDAPEHGWSDIGFINGRLAHEQLLELAEDAEGLQGRVKVGKRSHSRPVSQVMAGSLKAVKDWAPSAAHEPGNVATSFGRFRHDNGQVIAEVKNDNGGWQRYREHASGSYGFDDAKNAATLGDRLVILTNGGGLVREHRDGSNPVVMSFPGQQEVVAILPGHDKAGKPILDAQARGGMIWRWNDADKGPVEVAREESLFGRASKRWHQLAGDPSWISMGEGDTGLQVNGPSGSMPLEWNSANGAFDVQLAGSSSGVVGSDEFRMAANGDLCIPTQQGVIAIDTRDKFLGPWQDGMNAMAWNGPPDHVTTNDGILRAPREVRSNERFQFTLDVSGRTVGTQPKDGLIEIPWSTQNGGLRTAIVNKVAALDRDDGTHWLLAGPAKLVTIDPAGGRQLHFAGQELEAGYEVHAGTDEGFMVSSSPSATFAWNERWEPANRADFDRLAEADQVSTGRFHGDRQGLEWQGQRGDISFSIPSVDGSPMELGINSRGFQADQSRDAVLLDGKLAIHHDGRIILLDDSGQLVGAMAAAELSSEHELQDQVGIDGTRHVGVRRGDSTDVLLPGGTLKSIKSHEGEPWAHLQLLGTPPGREQFRVRSESPVQGASLVVDWRQPTGDGYRRLVERGGVFDHDRVLAAANYRFGIDGPWTLVTAFDGGLCLRDRAKRMLDVIKAPGSNRFFHANQEGLFLSNGSTWGEVLLGAGGQGFDRINPASSLIESEIETSDWKIAYRADLGIRILLSDGEEVPVELEDGGFPGDLVYGAYLDPASVSADSGWFAVTDIGLSMRPDDDAGSYPRYPRSVGSQSPESRRVDGDLWFRYPGSPGVLAALIDGTVQQQPAGLLPHSRLIEAGDLIIQRDDQDQIGLFCDTGYDSRGSRRTGLDLEDGGLQIDRCVGLGRSADGEVHALTPVGVVQVDVPEGLGGLALYPEGDSPVSASFIRSRSRPGVDLLKLQSGHRVYGPSPAGDRLVVHLAKSNLDDGIHRVYKDHRWDLVEDEVGLQLKETRTGHKFRGPDLVTKGQFRFDLVEAIGSDEKGWWIATGCAIERPSDPSTGSRLELKVKRCYDWRQSVVREDSDGSPLFVKAGPDPREPASRLLQVGSRTLTLSRDITFDGQVFYCHTVTPEYFTIGNRTWSVEPRPGGQVRWIRHDEKWLE